MRLLRYLLQLWECIVQVLNLFWVFVVSRTSYHPSNHHLWSFGYDTQSYRILFLERQLEIPGENPGAGYPSGRKFSLELKCRCFAYDRFAEFNFWSLLYYLKPINDSLYEWNS